MNRMRKTYQILLTSNYDTSLLLFCDGAYSPTDVANDAVHALVTIVTEEAVRAVAEVIVRRRTPIADVVTIKFERCPVTVARSRKEDTAAVWSYNI